MNKRKSASGEFMLQGSSGDTPIQSVEAAIELLWKELPTHKRVIAKTRNNENIYGTYIKVPDILRRLQEVFGLSYDISFDDTVHQIEDTLIVVVSCEVGVETPSGYRTVSDYGVAKLYDNGRLNEQAFKAAATDALKRAVRWLGIGMFQYENEEPLLLRSVSTDGGGEQKPKRSFEDEIAELFSSAPDRVETALSVMEELGVYDPEVMDEEEALLNACRKYKATPKQLLYAFKDKRTGERFLEAFEEGKPTKQIMNTLFADAKR